MFKASIAAIATVLALLTGGLIGSPANADSPGRSVSSVFNTPTQQQTIQAQAVKLVNAQKSGVIRLVMFHFASTDVARALVAAHGRGVQVRVTLDPSSMSTVAVKMLKPVLRGDGNYVTSHAPLGYILHDKFMTFSGSDTVLLSTANFTPQPLWNSAIITRGFQAYYAAYAKRADTLAGGKDGTFATVLDNGLKAYLLPQPKSMDVWRDIVANIGKGSDVDVAIFDFTDQSMADKLSYLATHGSSVQVIVSNDKVKLSKAVKVRHAKTGDMTVHTKELLVRGPYVGTAQRYHVFVGSANFTDSGIHHNDENLTRVNGAGTWSSFEANFTQMWETS